MPIPVAEVVIDTARLHLELVASEGIPLRPPLSLRDAAHIVLALQSAYQRPDCPERLKQNLFGLALKFDAWYGSANSDPRWPDEVRLLIDHGWGEPSRWQHLR